MTNTSDQRTDKPMDLGRTLVEDLDQYLKDGMPIYDLNGERIGKVSMHSTAAGYLVVKQGGPQKQLLYIPFRLIRSIDPHEIFLKEERQTLAAHHTEPPRISTISETRPVTGPNGTATQTLEVQMVESGYDGEPAVVNLIDVDRVTSRLAVGMAVYDVDGKRLGDITQYDIPRSLLVVERGIAKPRVLFVPFSAILIVDPENLSVSLALPGDMVVKEHSMLPANT